MANRERHLIPKNLSRYLTESYFGGIRKKIHAEERRRRERGADNKIPVFGMKKRQDGTVHTQIIENASKASLMTIMTRLIHTKKSIGRGMTVSSLTVTSIRG